MMTTSSERRLHPVSILFGLGYRLPRILLPAVAAIIAAPQRAAGVLFLAIAGVVVLIVVLSVVHYLRFTYRYDAAELVIRSGLLMRNDRRIPYARIQNLDAAQNPVHRLFDVAVVNVQTGGGAEPEASLRVLPLAALHEMRARVHAAGGRTGGAHASAAALFQDTPSVDQDTSLEDTTSLDNGASAERRTLLALQPRDLILAGFIENRGMVLIFAALAALEQTGINRMLLERLFEGEDAALADVATRWFDGSAIPVARGVVYATITLLAILLFIRLLSTVWAVVRLYDFRLERVGDELHTTYGLFTRVSATIPLRRVQTVIIRDGVLHRWLGRRALLVETAGGIEVAGARAREPIAPILRVQQLPALLDELHPGLVTADVAWRPVHPRAFGRMLRRSLIAPVALTVVAFVLVQAWAIPVFVVLLAIAFVHAHLRARHLAWSLTGDSIVVRDGALNRAVRVARFNRVQVVALNRSPFDVRTGMASVRADTAGARGGVVVPYLPEDAAAALQAELSARTAGTAFTW
jgi:putative membrane protein